MAKKTKKEKRRLREERREAERQAERRRNLITIGVVVAVVVVGGLLIVASLDDGDPLEEFEDLEDLDVEDLDDPGDPDEGDADDADGVEEDADDDADAGTGEHAAGRDLEREVACDGDVPAAAEEDKPTFDEPGQVIDRDAEYRAILSTSCGEVVMELDVERAPEAVNSFVFLAEEGFYDGLEFFRSRPGLQMVQTGAGDGSDTWDIGYKLPAELDAAEEDGYGPGAVALAVPEGEPDAGGSQFFVVYGDAFGDAIVAGALSRESPRFATVLEGLDVVREIGEIDVDDVGDDLPIEKVFIESVEIEAV